ncbi:hypothetical protein [Ferrovum myxofaciens]|uniref:hypothetical protein n=1 Tax=Ferrovum myxofaciens TaxID=416213 RepID=UPI00235607FB|nr:hypothetical protein [Ferrovum myxofaciens]MBU6995320.1 hypothetical protein [Ferrovum myxofaciens]
MREGGFALIQGDLGTGKSVALRALAERLERQTDLTVGISESPPEQPRGFTANWPRSSASCSNPATAGADSNPAGALDQSPRKPPDPLLSARLLMRPSEMSPKTSLELRLLASARFLTHNPSVALPYWRAMPA